MADRPLLDAARAARRSAVLRGASAEFQRAGVAAADLPAIARTVGLTRASLYNYCNGREDLARQCYLEALSDLHAVLVSPTAGRTGLERIVAFVSEAVGQDQPIAAIAAELDLLPEVARAEIEQAQARSFASLAALVEAGIADGSVRGCDPAIAARTIWGLAAWTPLGAMWSGHARDGMPARMAAELPDLVERGIVSDAGRRSTGRVTSDMIQDIWTVDPADRVEEIARTASSLFNRRGIEGVSLDDVAEAMGATKGLLYHHFNGKTDLVRHCLERGFKIYDRILSRAAEAPDGLEQSRRGIGINAMAQLHAIHPMSLNAFYRRLSDTDRARFTTLTDELLDRSIATARRGINGGLTRDFDAPAVALSSAGSFLFLARWMPPGVSADPVQVANEVCDLFLLGLQA